MEPGMKKCIYCTTSGTLALATTHAVVEYFGTNE